METFLAKEGKRNKSLWYFECPLHGDVPKKWREPNSMVRVLTSMKNHMNEHHPGVKARFKIEGEYTVHTTYTAISIVDTGGLL